MADEAGWIAPILASPGRLPVHPELHAAEAKWDGFRMITAVGPSGPRLWTRQQVDVTAGFPELHEIVELLAGHSAVLDGEVVALDATTGRPSFSLLQRRLGLRRPGLVRSRAVETPVKLLLFDVMRYADRDTTALPYLERRQLLEGLGLAGASVTVPAAWIGAVDEAVHWTQEQQLEGVVVKRLSSHYEAGVRSKSWVKVKWRPEQEVVIGGWTANRDGNLRSLLVGEPVPEHGLRYLGAVGTGFTERMRRDLVGLLAEVATQRSPFTEGWDDSERYARWVEPWLRGTVEYTDHTAAGKLRQPSWRGLGGDLAL